MDMDMDMGMDMDMDMGMDMDMARACACRVGSTRGASHPSRHRAATREIGAGREMLEIRARPPQPGAKAEIEVEIGAVTTAMPQRPLSPPPPRWFLLCPVLPPPSPPSHRVPL